MVIALGLTAGVGHGRHTLADASDIGHGAEGIDSGGDMAAGLDPATLEVSATVRARLDGTTGVVHWAERTVTMTIGDQRTSVFTYVTRV